MPGRPRRGRAAAPSPPAARGRNRLDRRRRGRARALRAAARGVTRTPSGTPAARRERAPASVSRRWAEQVRRQQGELRRSGACLRDARPRRRAWRRGVARSRATSVVGRAARELGRRPDLHQPARPHHADAVGQQQRLGHVVGHEDGGEPQPAPQRAERPCSRSRVSGSSAPNGSSSSMTAAPPRARARRPRAAAARPTARRDVGRASAASSSTSASSSATRARMRAGAQPARRSGTATFSPTVRCGKSPTLEHVADRRRSACGLERRACRGRRSRRARRRARPAG